MRISGIIENDVVNGVKVCVSLFTQGCHFRCKGCHNQDSWDFQGGIDIPISEVKEKIIKAISKNGIMRNFSILGGEPLCPENIADVVEIILAVKQAYPDISIFLWTGYTFENIPKEIVHLVDTIIDGPFEQEHRKLDLYLRGSTNQNIYFKGEKINVD